MFKGSSLVAKGFLLCVLRGGSLPSYKRKRLINVQRNVANPVVMFVLGETPTIAYVMRIIAKEWN